MESLRTARRATCHEGEGSLYILLIFPSKKYKEVVAFSNLYQLSAFSFFNLSLVGIEPYRPTMVGAIEPYRPTMVGA